MSGLSTFTNQHTPLRGNQPIQVRVPLEAVNSSLWTIGFSNLRSVWTVPTALYQGVALALLQEGIDSAVIAAFEMCAPQNFSCKEDTALRQIIRIALITALSSGLLVLISRTVAQTPYSNRVAFLLPEFSQNFGKVALVVASSHLLQVAGHYLIQQPVKKSNEERKSTRTARSNKEADADKEPTVEKKTHDKLLPDIHRAYIQDSLRSKNWDRLTELYNQQRETEAIHELDPEFWDAIKHIVQLHDLLKLKCCRCESLSEYSLAYEALELFESLGPSAVAGNESDCHFLKPSIKSFIAEIKPQIKKLGHDYLNLARQKITQAIDSYEKLTTILKDAEEHVTIRRSLTNTMEQLEILNNDQIEEIEIKRIYDRWRMDREELVRKDNKIQKKVFEIQCQERKKWVNYYTQELRTLFNSISFDFEFGKEIFKASDSEKYQVIERLLTDYQNKQEDRKQILSSLKQVCTSS